MNKLGETWERIRKFNYRKLLNSKSFLVTGCVVLLAAAFSINALVGASKKDESKDTTKILGNSVLVDNNVSNITDATGAVSDAADYFAVATINREKVRDEAMDVLQTIVDSNDALADTKEKALKDIAAIVSEMTAEANAESLIKAKGFSECVVIVSDKTASVIVKSDGLQQNEVAQILDIVYSEAGITPANVKIIEK